MEVAAGAMSPLLRKLGDLLVDEYNLENRVKKGIQSLETELSFMHSALRKVGEMPSHELDPQVCIWADKVRELSYEIEDAVDAFMVRVEEEEGCHHAGPINTKKRVKKFLKRATKLFRKGKGLHQISSAIDEAQDLAKQLAELRQRYGLEMQGTKAGSTIDPRLTAMYKDVTELVGIADPCEKMIKMLKIEGDEGSKKGLKVVSVVGFGGLGKTTLAKAVYDRIKARFLCAAFVSVSRNPDVSRVFKDMLYELDKVQFGHIHNANMDEKQLIDKLQEFLENKSYLIVIDDIWDDKAWKFIKCAFSENNHCCRLITTTRIASVAEACCSSTDDIIYRKDPLNDEDSRRLFHKRIFSHGKECPNELAQISIDILKKCGGVPLAIITIASLLVVNQRIKSIDQWYALLKLIGRGLEGDACVEDMQRILSFSYYDLPSHLKTCLLYLSVFPEDYVLGRDRLIWRWIAEGFVQGGKQETSLYDLGESYFNELINRGLIQPVDIDIDGRAKACHVRDMVLDLICSLSIKDNFLTILDGIKRNKPNSPSKIRRLSIQNTMVEPTTLRLDTRTMPQVRSVTLFPSAIDQMTSLSCFQVLRVLDLEYCDLREIGHKINMRCVVNLLHLRYLGLRSTYVLPKEIGKLQFLQTLDLVETGLKELVPSIVQLQHLMCIHFDKYTKLPLGMGNLTSLEELSELHVDRYSSGIVEELSHLIELRVLRINFEESDENQDKDFVEALGNLRKLQSLDINGNDGCVDLLREGWVPPQQLHRLAVLNGKDNRFLTLPAWISPSSLPLLSYLNIWLDEVQAKDVQIIGMLPCLRFLMLGAWRRIEEPEAECFVVTADAFPCVRECIFFNFVMAPSFPRGAMPMVQLAQFCFRACDIANANLDLSICHLTSLEQVRVDLWCKKASTGEVKEAEAALWLAVAAHPCCPTLYSRRR
ncbi:hypothetical protein CFC21_094989 [Triticum aestivum]|uniref:Uncharacterized protein n=2 Tax=Triticum aestivum TaxID=4565 RepID=A0A3B6R6E8_WHEAT|nr:disease resistance protein RGA5-like [Triticum aestivum]XP_044423688.1 disease resistance protein RGA5-like [Triticum aestivum]KAF7092513.1 hypothetical protein CFC21_094989 [Triticum aestivum]